MDFNNLSAGEKHERLIMQIQNDLKALQISARELEEIIDQWAKDNYINLITVEKLKDKIFKEV